MSNKKEDTQSATNSFFDKPTERFINRELSWLEFNMRVLEEASNKSVPLLERIKFLSISASNLDEFYMIRVAGLKVQINNNVSRKSQDGYTPIQQLSLIKHKALELINKQIACWLEIKQELGKKDIRIVDANLLNAKDKNYLKKYFLKNIFPALSPLAVDKLHPFPFIPNLGLNLILSLQDHKNHRAFNAVVLIPNKLSRFIRLDNDSEVERFILLEEVIIMFKEKLFTGMDIIDHILIHLTRDSELEISDEAEDFVKFFENAEMKRRRGNAVALRISGERNSPLKELLMNELKINNEDIYHINGVLNMQGLKDLYDCERPDLKFTTYIERIPERINDFGGDCFAAIKAKDIVVHHPYETFDVVVKYLQQAALDNNVIAIKQTLYRTTYDSPIIKALIQAAEAGKAVTVIVELKARFDEESNIRLSRDLERAGAQVVYGFADLKTHAKLSLIVRNEEEGLRTYVHFGTGNYHPVTSRLYSDLSFFTCNESLCKDAAYLFNFLTGYSSPHDFENLAVSPVNLRNRLIKLIEDEIEHANSGRPAYIWAKMNSLIDKKIIDALYTASQAGVKIELIIRGICGLRPNIKGFSENIRVKSIVGRFLEHARIYCFGNGKPLPNENAKLYIASADWMPRNFDRRIEVMVPITNVTVHEQIMGQILLANIYDIKQSWILQADGNYVREKYEKQAFCAHDYFMTNPSLSGRGKSISEEELKLQREKLKKLHDTREAK